MRFAGLIRLWVVYGALTAIADPLVAQTGKPATDSKGPLPIAVAGDSVLVKREAARLIEPDKYKTHLALEPIVSVTVSAPFDAVVRQVAVKANTATKAQQELVRLDHQVQKLHLSRAQAAFRAASIEQKLVDKKDENQTALAQAKLEIAKAELDLAQLYVDQSTLRSPIIGDVLRVFVTEGQYVRAGDPVAIVGDLTKLKIEIPSERSHVEKDKPFKIKVEQSEVDGVIEAVLPLSPRFDVLRDLFESIASATVVLDNPNGKWKPGQTVYVPLIPRFPVVEAPSGAIGNTGEGGRKVQVLRNSTVRDLPVTLMGPVGGSRLFVSGAFAEGDEVIYEASHALPDGFVLKSSAGATATTGGSTGGNAGAGGTTTTPPPRTGF